MNNQQFAEIAAFVSACSNDIVHGKCLSDSDLANYLDGSLQLFSRWRSVLRSFESQPETTTAEQWNVLQHQLNQLLEEIWSSEILTRVWGAVLAASGREMCSNEYETLARHVLIGHLNVRQEALDFLARNTALRAGGLSRINCVQLRVERWTDLLIGHLLESHDVDDFAFDPQRSREFHCRALRQSTDESASLTWTLLFSGLRGAFPTKNPARPAESTQQTDIISSILACFPTESLRFGEAFSSALRPHLYLQAPVKAPESAADTDSRQLSQTTALVTDWMVSFRTDSARSPHWVQFSDDN